MSLLKLRTNQRGTTTSKKSTDNQYLFFEKIESNGSLFIFL